MLWSLISLCFCNTTRHVGSLTADLTVQLKTSRCGDIGISADCSELPMQRALFFQTTAWFCGNIQWCGRRMPNQCYLGELPRKYLRECRPLAFHYTTANDKTHYKRFYCNNFFYSLFSSSCSMSSDVNSFKSLITSLKTGEPTSKHKIRYKIAQLTLQSACTFIILFI